MNRTVAGLTGDFGTGIHPPIMHTGPGCSWCKNEAGLTQDELDALTKWIELFCDCGETNP